MEEAFGLVQMVAVMIPAIACAWAGLQHVGHPSALGYALRQPPSLRRVITPEMSRNTARIWGIVEIGAGAGVCGVLLGPFSADARLGAVLSLTVIYVGFGLWIGMLWRSVPAATCGCSRRAEPADGIALLRAVVLGGCAAIPMLVLLSGQRLVVPPYGWASFPIALTLAVLAWVVPSSLRIVSRDIP